MRGATRLGKLALLLVALSASSLFLVPAHAQTELLPQDVPILEPVENPVKKVKRAVRQVAEKAHETTDMVKQVVEKAEDAVDETVKEVEETAGEVKERADRVLHGLLGESARPEPRDPKNSAGDDKDPEPRDDTRTERKTEVHALKTSANAGDGAPGGGSERGTITDGIALASERDAQQAIGMGTPATPGEVAEQLVFPLLMTLAVMAFLMLQGRFDRRDPKLAVHPELDGERLSFD